MIPKLLKPTLMAAASFSAALLLIATPVAAQSPSTNGNGQNYGKPTNSQSSNKQSDTAHTNSAGGSQGGGAVQSAPASTLESAAGPFANSVSIAAHTSQWYKFKYGFNGFIKEGSKDKDKNSDSDTESPSRAQVELKMSDAGCVSFEIWTPDRLNAPAPTYTSKDRDEIVRTPVGAGSPVYRGVDQSKERTEDSRVITDAKDLVWVGGAALSNTYYVRVRNATDAACSYSLAITGPDVSYQQAR